MCTYSRISSHYFVEFTSKTGSGVQGQGHFKGKNFLSPFLLDASTDECDIIFCVIEVLFNFSSEKL
jgi:hypothetical protein